MPTEIQGKEPLSVRAGVAKQALLFMGSVMHDTGFTSDLRNYLKEKGVFEALTIDPAYRISFEAEVDADLYMQHLVWFVSASSLSSLASGANDTKKTNTPTLLERQQTFDASALTILDLVEHGELPENTEIFSYNWMNEFVEMHTQLGHYEIIDSLTQLRPENERWNIPMKAALVTREWDVREKLLQQSLGYLEKTESKAFRSFLSTEDLVNVTTLLRIHDLPLPSAAALRRTFEEVFESDKRNHKLQLLDSAGDFILSILAHPELTSAHLAVVQEAYGALVDYNQAQESYLQQDVEYMADAIEIAGFVLDGMEWSDLKSELQKRYPWLEEMDKGRNGTSEQWRSLIPYFLLRNYTSEKNSDEVIADVLQFIDDASPVSPYAKVWNEPYVLTAQAVAGLLYETDIQGKDISASHLGKLLRSIYAATGLIEVTEDGKTYTFLEGNSVGHALLQFLRQRISDQQLQELKNAIIAEDNNFPNPSLQRLLNEV